MDDFDLQSNWDYLKKKSSDFRLSFHGSESDVWLPAREHALLIFSDSDNDNCNIGLAICGLSSIEVDADLLKWSSKFLLEDANSSLRFSLSENPRRIFLQGCCRSKLLRGWRGALGLLKLAKGLDSGEVISSQNLLISGELLTVFNCKFCVSTMEKHRRKGVALWWLFKLGETPVEPDVSKLLKSNFRRSCRTYEDKKQ